MAEILLTEDKAINIPQVRRHENQPQQKPGDGPGWMAYRHQQFKGIYRHVKNIQEEEFKRILWSIFGWHSSIK